MIFYSISEMSDILHYLGNVWDVASFKVSPLSTYVNLRHFVGPDPDNPPLQCPPTSRLAPKFLFAPKIKNIYVELYKFDFKVLSLSLCSYQTLLHKVFWNWKTKLFPSLHRPTCCPAGVLQLIGNGSIPFHSGCKDPSLLVVAHKSGYRSKHKGTLMLLSLIWDIFQTGSF